MLAAAGYTHKDLSWHNLLVRNAHTAELAAIDFETSRTMNGKKAKRLCSPTPPRRALPVVEEADKIAAHAHLQLKPLMDECVGKRMHSKAAIRAWYQKVIDTIVPEAGEERGDGNGGGEPSALVIKHARDFFRTCVLMASGEGAPKQLKEAATGFVRSVAKRT
ncbi:unnamed protein product [Vitrella brassicaformis CCMP3155]|uniref:Protein kinase domain-containing protein n=1 Tax=Vitrella brassicaformis (strain CCMP3155) TaxID=1169540 RepID=A0A0G4EMQ0_VITBC|nr:unnamed protein product [Vitrella brassicaformis CCMP3155]|eukprot:CEL98260.1 unnamed protein product [Vitrella brassicaformis CCMP3155]